MKRRDPNQRTMAKNLAIYLLAIVSGFTIVFPYVWILITSFENDIEALSYPPFPLKSVTFSVSNYIYDLTVTNLSKALIDSTIVAIGASILVFTLSAWAAYTMSKIRFRGRNLLYSMLIVLYMIPGLPMLIPVIIMLRELHLIDTLPGLIIGHGILLVPLMTWFLIGIFDSVPNELDEAARADGLSRFWTILRVDMPLAKTGMALILVFSFTISWNELMFSNTLGQVNTPMLQPAILNFTLGSAVQWTQMAAGGIISSLPIVVLALLLQRYIIAGIMKGAIK